MIHLLTFQSTIKECIVFFFKFGGYRNIFYTPPPTLKKNIWGGGRKLM